MQNDGKKQKRRKPEGCRYNDHVSCMERCSQSCAVCGWNPAVQQARKKQRRQPGGK